ncbi:MAG: 5'/3'-nucleotidase SurE [Bdellovibrionales bacterium]|nr:5'/3'-nucleotidase SurE [Bdellovibrionales bacterium]
MRILLSNDDGVHAPGLKILYEELKKIGKVKVVAPLEEKSTTGHSLTLHKPLRLIQMDTDFYGVNGSPADCVYLGIKQVMRSLPDLVVSGINRGANLGQDVYYSGTVSAAREACILGLPSYAVSLNVDFKSRKVESKLNYLSAAKQAVKIIKEYQKKGFPKYTLMNINVPDLPLSRIKGIKAARQGFRHYSSAVLKRVDHRGKDYFWVGGQYMGFQPDVDTDCHVVDQGYTSITPLKLDVTDMAFLEEIKRLSE